MLRPARAQDFEALKELWRQEARAGLRDFPTPRWLDRLGAAFDCESRARVVESGGEVSAAVAVIDRRVDDGVVTRLEIAGGGEEVAALYSWGALFSRAAGARAAQVWSRKGVVPALPEEGWSLVRGWIRMDRGDLGSVAESELPPGYRLRSQDSQALPAHAWIKAYNTAFAEHWNFSPATAEDFAVRFSDSPDLLLMALSEAGEPAAFVWAQLEELDPEDPRPVPSGLLATVGTLPGHRRRGLAGALCLEALRRLRAHGARGASLYVDAQNATRAFDVYRRAGFRNGWESDVWELDLTKF